ncbi:MAG: nitrous oxide reductase family maturation protein NosD [Bacteroidetes bacterium]|nr:nitrous oxide reductase family maturation protein NosD [Bacteroidota bacterium]
MLFLKCGFLFGKEITVCSECGIKTIKEALDISQDGDRIIIKSGYYREHDLKAEKSVEIIGESFPVIDIDSQGNGFILTKENSSVSGLIIKNMSASYVKDLAAIKIENTSKCKVLNNQLLNTFFSIYLANSRECVISGNTITGNAVTETSSGNGIHLWKCRDIIIENNRVSGQRDGIYLEFVISSLIRNNLSEHNLRYGLHFMYSDSNAYRNNTFISNGAGVAVMYSHYIEMTENHFYHNWGAASYGLLLKDITRSRIYKNLISENTTGIYMESCDKIIITENEFSGNGWALKIMGNCSDNILSKNNFSENTFDIASNSSRNKNFYSENYWDKYDGYDLNKDGTGDIPYRPVSLYSMMLEKIPDSIILLRSFIVDLIDITEKAMPVFIPETLADENPRMHKYQYDKN